MNMTVELSPTHVEVARKRPDFRRYRLTQATWNRVMYLARKHQALIAPHEIRFTGQEHSARHAHLLHVYIETE